MVIRSIRKKDLDHIFLTAQNQGEAIVAIYKLVYPDWDKIDKIHDWPKVNKETWKEIAEMFRAFDKIHHPDCMPGGCWLNSGFSTYYDGDGDLKKWQVDLSGAKVEYKADLQAPRTEVFGGGC